MSARRVVLIATALTIVGLACYPPFVFQEQGQTIPVGYGWLFAPPVDRMGNAPRDTLGFAINASVLATEWLGVLLVGGLIWLAAGTSRQAPQPVREVDRPGVGRSDEGTRRDSSSHSSPVSAASSINASIEPVKSGPANLTRPLRTLLSALVFVAIATAGVLGRVSGRIAPMPLIVGASLIMTGWGIWLFLGLGDNFILSPRLRAYKAYCETLSRDELTKRVEGALAREDQLAWHVTEPQRQTVLDVVVGDRINRGNF